MGCLKLQAGTLKQCLQKEDGHAGDCIFTLLRPEVAAAQDKRKERDNQLVRRQVAQGLMPSVVDYFIAYNDKASASNPNTSLLIDDALALADELIAKTGGFGP